MPITLLPTPPVSTNSREFAAKADAFIAALPKLVDEINSTALFINANGVLSTTYILDIASITDADPGNGVLRFNNFTLISATLIYIDNLDTANASWDKFYESMPTFHTSGLTAYLRVRKTSDATKFMVLAISGDVDTGTYHKINCNAVAWSSSTPFTNGDNVTLEFIPVGDKATLDFSVSGTGVVTPPAAPTAACVGYIARPNFEITGHLTLAMSHLGKIGIHLDGSAYNVTFPPNSSVAYPTGTQIEFYNLGAGAISLLQGAGVLLRMAGTGTSGTKTLALYGKITATKVQVNDWVIEGAGVT